MFLKNTIGVCPILIFRTQMCKKGLFCNLLILALSCCVKINGEQKLMRLRYIIAYTCVSEILMYIRGRKTFSGEHFPQFKQSVKYLHWPLFKYLKDIYFQVCPNFKIFAGIILSCDDFWRYWNWKKKELIYVNQKWYHDKIYIIFVIIRLLLHFSRDNYTNLFEFREHVAIHTCAQVLRLPCSYYGGDQERILYEEN